MPSNPNLQKIIKLTKTQYETLSSGGTVGDYTGLNDNYLYLIQEDTDSLPLLKNITSSSTTTVKDLCDNIGGSFALEYEYLTYICYAKKVRVGTKLVYQFKAISPYGYYEDSSNSGVHLIVDVLEYDGSYYHPYATLDKYQTFTDEKVFESPVTFENYDSTPVVISFNYTESSFLTANDDENGVNANFTLADLTDNRTYTFPDASGTIALTSDLPQVKRYI